VNDSPHEVVAFTADADHIAKSEFHGLPVVPFEDLPSRYPPDDFQMFVALGYQNMNSLRATKYRQAKDLGYTLISYVNSRASNFGRIPLGDNCLVLENAVLQPGATIGNNVFVWSGNHIGHHARIEDHCYIAGQAVISGSTTIGPYCFIGVNATIGHEITIGRESFVGANCFLTKNAEAKSVFVMPDTPKFRLDSASFLRLTKMK
jgi:sugar O-acyltransferase (sialic acid O-acetyltransferase NeuD family)